MSYESKILSQKLVHKKKSNKSMIMEKKYLWVYLHTDHRKSATVTVKQ